MYDTVYFVFYFVKKEIFLNELFLLIVNNLSIKILSFDYFELFRLHDYFYNYFVEILINSMLQIKNIAN